MAMTAKTRAAAIQKIKIAQGQLHINETEYQTLLADCGDIQAQPGQRLSATQLGDWGIENVLAALRGQGFVDTRPARAGRVPHVPLYKQALSDKIQALLAEAGKPTDYADGIGKRMFKVERIEFLTPQQMGAVVAALEKTAKKKRASA